MARGWLAVRDMSTRTTQGYEPSDATRRLLRKDHDTGVAQRYDPSDATLHLVASVLERFHAQGDTAAIASLMPLTPEAKRSIGVRIAVEIRQLPFKVGRENSSP